MQDLWRLSATDLAALIRSKKVSAKEAATAALARLDAVNPAINAVIEHRPAEVLAQAAAIDAAIAAARIPVCSPACPVTVKVNIDQAGFATTNGLKLQKRRDREGQQPGGRQSAQGRRRHSRPHQLPGVFLSLVHHQSDPWRHQEPARSRRSRRVARPVARVRRSRPASATSRMAPISPARSAIPPMPAACTACGRRVGRIAAFNAALPERTIGPQISAVSGPLARTIGDLRIALAAMAGGMRAIPGGCRRRWKARRARSAPRCACIPTGWIPCRR